MADKSASFSLKLEGDVAAKSLEGAAALEQLRARMQQAMSSIRQMRDAQSALKGNTDEVKQARERFKASIEAEQTAMARASVALLRQGTSYKELTKQARSARQEAEKLKAANARTKVAVETEGIDKLKAAGGPLSSLLAKLGELRGAAGQAGGGTSVLAYGAGLLAVGIVAATAAVIGAIAALARWAVAGANAARTAGLLREAVLGSAQQANALGTQIDALSSKVSTGRDELEGMARGLVREFDHARISGKGLIDTFNLMAVAGDAVGGDVANQLGNLVKRMKDVGTFRLSLDQVDSDLRGTGLKFDDVAQALAESMKIGIAQARANLAAGAVSLDQGAAALRAAVEKRFGAINARKLLDLDVQFATLRKNVGKIFAGFNVEPLLKALATVLGLFDTNKTAGYALREIFKTIGKIIGPEFQGGADIAKAAFKELVIVSLKVTIAVLELRNRLKTLFRDVDASELKKTIGEVYDALKQLGGPIEQIELLGPVFIGMASNALECLKVILAVKKEFSLGWEAIGDAIVSGIKRGIFTGGRSLLVSMKDLANDLRDTFKSTLGIHSPSSVFRDEARQVPRGAALGIRDGAGDVQRAADAMSPAPRAGRAQGSAGSRSVVVNINVSGASDGRRLAGTLSEPSFLSALTKAIEDALIVGGLPVQVEVG